MHSYLTAALLTVAKVWKQPKWSLMGEQIKKMCCINTMKYYSVIKRKEILPFHSTGGS